MIYYFLILIADMFLTVSFLAQKKYQSGHGSTLVASLRFSIISGLASALVFLAVLGFKPAFTGFSVGMSFLQTSCTTAYTLIGFLILKHGTLSLYTLFLMTGGMMLPYIFGVIFLDEQLTAWRVAGLVVITISLFLTNFKKGESNLKKTLPLCITVFVFNGFVSIISKVHQINPAMAVSSNDFVFWISVMKVVICLPIYLVIKKDKGDTLFKNGNIPMIAIIAFSSVASAINYLLQLISVVHLPASVAYPMLTGGNIVLTALAGRIFFREKLSKGQIIAIVICAAGTCMFL